MDGLILDTEPLALRAWSECARAVGVPFDRTLGLRMVGRNFTDCAALVRAEIAACHPIDALLDNWHATYDAIVARDGVTLKAGVTELLDWLDRGGLPRAVATSTRRERARAKLAQAGVLARFHSVVGGDDVVRGKPAPDIYLEAARRLEVAPADCLVLEDSEPGVRAGLAAGMAVIMVPDLIAPPAELAAAGPIIVRSLTEARAHLAALE
jgi:HAD superfamily hydrolase (TIGR01509 family)